MIVNDTDWLISVNDFAVRTPWLHGLVVAYANYGIAIFALLLAAGLWVARQRDDPQAMAAALWAPIGMLLALAINQPIADAVGEVRPCTAVTHILVLARCANDFSFPSDHAVMAGAVAAGLVVVASARLIWLAVLAALLMAFARVYVAVHYPHDVIAGLLVGAVISVVGWVSLRGVLTRVVTALWVTRVHPLLTSAPPRPEQPV